MNSNRAFRHDPSAVCHSERICRRENASWLAHSKPYLSRTIRFAAALSRSMAAILLQYAGWKIKLTIILSSTLKVATIRFLEATRNQITLYFSPLLQGQRRGYTCMIHLHALNGLETADQQLLTSRSPSSDAPTVQEQGPIQPGLQRPCNT